MTAYMYFRTNNWLETDKLCKQGITKRNPFERDKEYITYEPIRGSFISIISISKIIIDSLDITIKNYFMNLNAKTIDEKNDGGTEYFTIDIVDKVKEYLLINNIKHHILNKDEIDDLHRKFLIREKISKLDKQKIKELLLSTYGKIIPNDLQQIVHEKALNYYKNNDIGKIIWACGCGKTKLSILLIKGLNAGKIIIGVSSKYLQEQFLQSLLQANIDPLNILLVGSIKSDICHTSNNIDNIDKFYNKQRKISIILVTYKSSHLLENFNFDFKIADEAHHLTGKMNSDIKKSYLLFHNIQSKKTLFMTATEKIIEDGIALSMDTEYFGNCIDIRTFKWAIENKKITDYNLLVLHNSINEILIIGNALNICLDNYELFLSAIMVLKSIAKYEDLTHIVLYTNSIENAIIIKDYIDEILSKNIFDFDNIYNEALYSNNKINLEQEIKNFSKAKIGIISSVYIFGEGFDLPKLNGVCFCENMNSEIRIIQCAFRANRIDYNKPNKISYIIVPYIDSGNWNDENDSFQKLRKIISKLRNVDENIEQRIKLYTTNNLLRNNCNLSNIKGSTLRDNTLELDKIKIRLRHSTTLMNNKWKDEYEYLQILNKQYEIKSKQQYLNMREHYDFYIADPEKYFNAKGLWNGWYDFMCVDTSVFIQTKDEWKEYCKSLNIVTLNDYKEMCLEHECLPIDPSNFYLDFTSVVNELIKNNKRR